MKRSTWPEVFRTQAGVRFVQSISSIDSYYYFGWRRRGGAVDVGLGLLLCAGDDLQKNNNDSKFFEILYSPPSCPVSIKALSITYFLESILT